MKTLTHTIIDKHKNFDKEMIHVCDNCFIFISSTYIDIVLENDTKLECYGFSKSAVPVYKLKQILEQPVLSAVDNKLVDISLNNVKESTIDKADSCKALRVICKQWRDNHYTRMVYNGNTASVFATLYCIAGGDPKVCLQAVNYGKRDMEGSFTIDKALLEKVYNKMPIKS